MAGSGRTSASVSVTGPLATTGKVCVWAPFTLMVPVNVSVVVGFGGAGPVAFSTSLSQPAVTSAPASSMIARNFRCIPTPALFDKLQAHFLRRSLQEPGFNFTCPV